MLAKESVFILALVLTSVACMGDGVGNTTKSTGMAACRSALQTYGEVMGNLQSCVVTSILPSNICTNCLVPYLAVRREYEHLDSVQFSEKETCKQFYVNSAHFLSADSYMFTHTFDAAVNASSPFVRAHCDTCYVNGDKLTMMSDLKPSMEAYLEAYIDVKACFDKWAYVHDNTVSPVCSHCHEVFDRSQQLFKHTIMFNATDYLTFSKVCLDVADRYQELNHIYQKYDCNPNVHSYTDMTMEFGFGIGFLVVCVFIYGPTISWVQQHKDMKRQNAIYIRSQCSENMQGIRGRMVDSLLSLTTDNMNTSFTNSSIYTLSDGCPYPSAGTRRTGDRPNDYCSMTTEGFKA